MSTVPASTQRKLDALIKAAVSRLFKTAASKGLSITALADASDVGRVTLQRWKRGSARPELGPFLAVEGAVRRAKAKKGK